MQFTNELVHSLQSNKQQPSKNVARLLQLYDEATYLVTISNTSHNKSS